MLKRKTHRKSRLGCKNCKLRRTKCDETHPACGNCVKHEIPCDFNVTRRPPTSELLAPIKIPPLRKSTSRASPASTASHVSGSSETQSSPVTSIPRRTTSSPLPDFAIAVETLLLMRPPLQPSIGTPADQLLNLRLLHHYVQMTSTKPGMDLLDSYEAKVGGQRVWARWITTLAFSNQSLMDALLGFSAFHLRSLNPSDRELFEVSHKYMAKALEGHANELRNGLDEKNAEAAFATSTFVASHTCSGQRFLLEREGPPQVPLHWFRAYRGVRAILEAGWEWIKTAEIRFLITNEFEFVNTIFQYPESGTGSSFGFLLKDLDLESHDAENTRSYKAAVATLNWVNNTETPRHILRFPAMVSSRFIQLLTVQDPRILTIVGYFFMLLKKVETIWWLKGTVDKEFWALMEILPKSWWPQMDMAIRVFQE